MGFVDAVRALAERFGIEIQEQGSDQDQRQAAEARRRQHELYDIGNAAASFFERQLREHPLASGAREELQRRGLQPASATDAIATALQAFRVGYAPRSWDELLRHLRELGFPPAACESVGLLVPRSSGSGHYDRFRHRLMFAVIDVQGRVVAFSGRALAEPSAEQLKSAGQPPGPSAEGQEAPAKYVNSPESPIYKKRDVVFGLYQARQAIRESGRAVLVEGNFDVVSLHARGLGNAVAPLGTAFTAEQAALIRRFTAEITLLFDGDAAGRRAVRAARDSVRAADLGCRVASLPDGVDPDELSRTGGREAIERVLGASRGLLEFLIDASLSDSQLQQDVFARATAIREVTELLSSETEPEVRALAERYADQVAERLGISDARTFRALAQRVRQALGESASAHPEKNARPEDRPSPIALEALGTLLDFPELLDDPEFTEVAELFEGELAIAVAAWRRAQLGSLASGTEQFLAKLSGPIHQFAAKRLANPPTARLEEARKVLLSNMMKLKQLGQLRRKPDALQALERARAAGDFDAELELLREQMGQARRRHGVGER